MAVYARGVAKTLTIAAESAFGTAASGAGQMLRRLNGNFDAAFAPIVSQEILPSQQVRDARHGPMSVAGTITGNLTSESYNLILQQVLRGSFAGGPSMSLTPSSGVITVPGSINIDVSNVPTLTLDGLKIGDVYAVSGLQVGSTPVTESLRLIASTASGGANTLVFAPIPGDDGPLSWSGVTPTIGAAGQKLTTPPNGQTDQSFTIEQYYRDLGLSELVTGAKFTSVGINVPASGLATFQANAIAQRMVNSNSQYFPTAAPVVTTDGLTSNGGAVYYNGQQMDYFASLSLQIGCVAQAIPTLGTLVSPYIFLGMLRVSGTFTTLAAADQIGRDARAETEVSLGVTLTDTLGHSFVSIFLPRVRIHPPATRDTERAIIRSYNFTALQQVQGGGAGAYDDTTVTFQDSLAA